MFDSYCIPMTAIMPVHYEPKPKLFREQEIHDYVNHMEKVFNLPVNTLFSEVKRKQGRPKKTNKEICPSTIRKAIALHVIECSANSKISISRGMELDHGTVLTMLDVAKGLRETNDEIFLNYMNVVRLNPIDVFLKYSTAV